MEKLISLIDPSIIDIVMGVDGAVRISKIYMY